MENHDSPLVAVAEAPRVDRVGQAASALDEALRAAPGVDLSWVGRPLAEDGWEAAPDLLRLLFALVERLRPKHVLEFGSGLSTVVLARAASTVPGCVVTSIDHDPAFAAATAALLANHGDRVVVLGCAPLVARVRAGQLQPCYLVDDELLGSRRAPDLIVVDGPPAVLGGRRGMLPLALEYAQSGSIILFDDADREVEAEALADWEGVLGDAVEIHRPQDFARGLAAVILVAPTVARIRLTPRPS
jgi:Methyltransferase domain